MVPAHRQSICNGNIVVRGAVKVANFRLFNVAIGRLLALG